MAQLVKKLFSKYLLLTNTITSGSLLAAGDLITQNIEQRFMHKKKDESAGVVINWKRTGNLLVMLEHEVLNITNKIVFRVFSFLSMNTLSN